MKKILYLHAGSEFYGADKVLRDLIAGLDKTQFEPHVILPSDGILVGKLREAGAKVSVIEYPILRRKYFVIQHFWNLYDFVLRKYITYFLY